VTQSRAVLSIVVCGLIGVGIGVVRHRLVAQPADEVERLPDLDLLTSAPQGQIPEAPVASAAMVAGPPTSMFGDSGLSTVLPEGCTARGVQASVNRIVRIEKAKKLVVAINRGPLYPWVDKALAGSSLGLKGWRDGSITEPLALTLPNDGWAFQDDRLHLLTQNTRLIISLGPAGSWESPEVQSVLRGLTVTPMVGVREWFAGAIKLDPEVGRGPVLPATVEDVNKALATIRTVPAAAIDLGPITEAGIKAHEAGSLDQLDTLILLSTLHPFVARLTDGDDATKGTPPPDCMPTGTPTGSSHGAPHGAPTEAESPFPPAPPR
jgi:hypothetical protein